MNILLNDTIIRRQKLGGTKNRWGRLDGDGKSTHPSQELKKDAITLANFGSFRRITGGMDKCFQSSELDGLRRGDQQVSRQAAKRAAEMLCHGGLRLVIADLGNGASASAVGNGISSDMRQFLKGKLS